METLFDSESEAGQFEDLSDFRFRLRDYQQQAVDAAFDLFQTYHGVLIRSPTGTGKTIQGAAVIHRWLKENSRRRALVIAHERNLIWQFAEEIEDAIGIDPGIEMASRNVQERRIPLVTVASRATLQNRSKDEDVVESRVCKFDLDKYEWLVVWDEAHRHHPTLDSVKHILRWFNKKPVTRHLGLTATPERGDKKSLEAMFPAVAADYRLFTLDGPNAVSDGWAVPYEQYFVPISSIDFNKVGEAGKKRDWKDAEIDAELNNAETVDSMVEPMLEIVGNRRTIIFSPTREMAGVVAAAINARIGAKSARALDGTVAENTRKRTYEAHKTGKFQFLSVCGLCREGYNDPGIAAVVIFRPTKSRSLAEQMKGRGCRPLKGIVDGIKTPEERRKAIESSEKPNCLIVDLVGVTGLGECASTAEIYAEGIKDKGEVLDLVNKWVINAAKEGKPINMRDAVSKAQEEIEERKRKKKEAEERRLKEMEEKRKRRLAEREAAARRRQRFGMQVDYSKVHVPQGQKPENTSTAVPTRKEYKYMPYGRFRGTLISKLPLNYLRYLVENKGLSNSIKNEVFRVWKSKNPDFEIPGSKKDKQERFKESPPSKGYFDLVKEILGEN